jgi:ATP-dependent helicase/nuclease subunit A
MLARNPEGHPFTVKDFESIFRRRADESAKLLREAAMRIKEETTKAQWVEMADGYLALADCLKGNWTEVRNKFLLLRDALKTARRSPKGPQPVSESTIEFAKEAREYADDFLEPVYDPEAWKVFAERYEVIDEIGKRFSHEFRKRKLAEGYLEISDLEHLAMDCIRAHPQTAEAFWQEWDHWLIDEYQDTSPFQVELLRHLSGERPNFVVGDPQQSIYLFRGARSEVFGEKENEILQGGGQQRLLSVNRRSRPELLLFFNDFFSRFDPPFQPMQPFFKEGETLDPKRVVAKVFLAHDSAPEEEGDEEESSTEAVDAETKSKEEAPQEIRAIICHVQEILAKGGKPEDICVLGRTNRVLMEVALWLSRYRLPTHVHAASGFYDRREIRDALALLKFLVNPHDNGNLVELLRSPWFRVPDRALAPITRERPESLWETLLEQRSMADELRPIARLQDMIQQTLKDGLSETFKRGLIDSGFIDLSHTHDVSGRRESNVWKLLARLQQEECKPGFNPLVFIAGSVSDLRTEEGNAEGDAVAAVEPDRINLMTVHASKGLEFPHVILPRMDQKPRLTLSEEFTYDEDAGRWAVRVPYGENRDMTGSLPESAWLERFRAQEQEEHARVLYVALTRASESVFLSWTQPAQKNSWAESVHLDLAPGLHEGESYSYLVDQSDPHPKESDWTEEEAIEPREKWLVVPHSVQGPLEIPVGGENQKALSVTQILNRKAGLHFGPATDAQVSRLLKLASHGTAVHRLMEMLKYPASRDHMGKLVRKWFPRQEEDVLAAIQFVRRCTEPPLVEVIKNGEVEWGFSFVEDGVLIEGQIDLWGRDDEGDAWIIDYKTGNPELKFKAFEQMSLYGLALRKSGALSENETLRMAAVYPFAQEVYIEDEAPLEKVRKMLGLA